MTSVEIPYLDRGCAAEPDGARHHERRSARGRLERRQRHRLRLAQRGSVLIRVQERETGFFTDLECLLERLVPLDAEERTRLVSMLLGPRTEQIPFSDGSLCLGQYQRIFLVAFEDHCSNEWMLTVVA